ncbi:hypothetical protein ACHAAC_11925 [Aeromicrobium sp. CF4.19]|uniref:hypothetical protein n=1 Tax=Aeromicrobium sp. CF4.19 TaxID=3373082 RepID=UPI003EE7F992
MTVPLAVRGRRAGALISLGLTLALAASLGTPAATAAEDPADPAATATPPAPPTATSESESESEAELEAEPEPTPPPKPQPPKPTKPRKPKVSVSLTTKYTLPAVRAASSSRARSTFVLQRHNGKRWITLRVRKSNAKGVYTFAKVPFSTLRVTVRPRTGYTFARSRNVNSRAKWHTGYPSLGIKNASVSVTPLGQGPITIGDHRRDRAWSTIKVPIVITADRLRRGSAADKKGALRYSDNAAANRVYQSLGGNRRTDVTRHLRKYGDKRTSVHGSGAGLTQWGVSHQSKYASRIACSRVAKPARVHMKKAQTSHRFGMLGTKLAKRTSQKVGYGGSVVRQLAIVKLSDGRAYGVSILADGGFRSARAKVDRIARWVANRLEYLPARRC